MIRPALTALTLCAALAGCANQRFTMAGDATISAVPRSEESQSFFIGGLGQSQTVDAAKACAGASKVDSVAVEQTPLNALLSAITLGIYTPRTARVYCK